MKLIGLSLALFTSITCGHSSLLAETVAWQTVREFAAPEAIQAAAADEQFVYAVASREIAKYDRVTGKKIAISTGDAKHLNSGFLWQGKLLCAHSNYPQLPERSVFD